MKNKILKAFKIEPYLRIQGCISFCVDLGFLMNGVTLGWSAPMIQKITSPEQSPLPYTITDTAATWIGTMVFVGCFIAWIPGLLLDIIGRKKCIILSGIFNLTAYLLLLMPRNLSMIFAGRILASVAMSFAGVSILPYLGEIASSNIRGLLLTSASTCHVLGSLLMYSIGPFLSYTNVGYVVLSICVLFIILSFKLPESPLYYVIKDDIEAAKSTLQYLERHHDIDKDLKTMVEGIKLLDNKTSKLQQLISLKSNRKSLFITMSLYFFQQASGVMVVLLFATDIFESANSSIKPEIATIIIGATSFIGTLISPTFVETYGRKILLLISSFGFAVAMTVLGTYFYLVYVQHPSATSMGVLPLISLVGGLLSYSIGLHSIPGTLVGEFYSPNVRGIGSSISLYSGGISGLLTTIIFGYVVAYVGSHIIFWIFAIINIMAFTFVVIFVPETKGKSLSEIQSMLNR